MQIFIIDYSPERAAGMLCDLHLRKMCLETAQILSSVMFRQGKTLLPEMPRPYNLRHPVIMAVDTPLKINWTVCHNSALHQEYFKRFGKHHAYFPLAAAYCNILFTAGIKKRPELLGFARAFKGIDIDEPDIVNAYRIYYRYKKSIIKNWRYTNSKEPEWLTVF